jgi:hypothetical protein
MHRAFLPQASGLGNIAAQSGYARQPIESAGAHFLVASIDQDFLEGGVGGI